MTLLKGLLKGSGVKTNLFRNYFIMFIGIAIGFIVREELYGIIKCGKR
jgi:hypothetical protein